MTTMANPLARNNSTAITIEEHDMEKNKKTVSVEISVPAVGRLLNPQYGKFTKMAWILVMMTSIVVSFYLTADRVQWYLSYPTTVQNLVERKKMITFPSLSICSDNIRVSYDVMYKKIEAGCKALNMTCHNHDSVKFAEIGMNWTETFYNLSTIKIEAELPPLTVSGADYEKETFSISSVLHSFGICTIVTHHGELAYFSAGTYVDVKILKDKSRNISEYKLIIHGKSASEVLPTDLLINEYENVRPKGQTKLRIQEKRFQMLNVSGNECYDEHEERQRINECAMDIMLNKKSICRLPTLPESFEECKYMRQIVNSVDKLYFAFISYLKPNCPVRRICNQTIYSITVDSVDENLYNEKRDKKASYLIRFADDLVHINEESYTYSLQTLIGDLTAYWGFFLCVTAMTFIEIFEYLFKVIYNRCQELFTCCPKKKSTN